nr:ribosome biogenesis protein BMS1 homolog isoform X2 [Macaca nemestrina]
MPGREIPKLLQFSLLCRWLDPFTGFEDKKASYASGLLNSTRAPINSSSGDGASKVGKSTLIQCLIGNFTRQKLTEIRGPVRIVSGKKRRLTIIECGCDINMMIDLAKVADLGAKLFCLSGMVHGEYQNQEMHNLGRFITVMKFRLLTWQTSHPYILADRMEDLTNPEDI